MRVLWALSVLAGGLAGGLAAASAAAQGVSPVGPAPMAAAPVPTAPAPAPANAATIPQAARGVASGPSVSSTAATAAAPAGGATPPADAVGSGDVNLSPRRLILGGRARSGEVIVFNRGTGKAIYRVELRDMAMAASGTLTPADKVDPAVKARLHSASDLVRYSPRRVELGPGESQVIRVLARSPTDATPAAEYRTHLVVSAVPPVGAGLEISQAAGVGAGQLRIQIVPIFGISIPLILRPIEAIAPTTASWTGSRLVSVAGKPHVQATLTRQGEHSIFGDAEVRYTPRAGGKPVLVGQLRGVGVYTEVDSRPLDITLAPPDGVSLGAGTYDLTFRDDETPNGKVLAQASVAGP